MRVPYFIATELANKREHEVNGKVCFKLKCFCIYVWLRVVVLLSCYLLIFITTKTRTFSLIYIYI